MDKKLERDGPVLEGYDRATSLLIRARFANGVRPSSTQGRTKLAGVGFRRCLRDNITSVYWLHAGNTDYPY
jgi:hypothetical protein